MDTANSSGDATIGTASTPAQRVTPAQNVTAASGSAGAAEGASAPAAAPGTGMFIITDVVRRSMEQKLPDDHPQVIGARVPPLPLEAYYGHGSNPGGPDAPPAPAAAPAASAVRSENNTGTTKGGPI